jgi:type II secretory pathway component GspD/PulD (secretin)
MKATTYVLLLSCCLAAWAQASLEVIDLRHGTAEQVLPALRPLLEPGGVLTGQRNQLIVRTSARNLAELRRALEALDAPARRLVIAVRFEGVAAEQRTEIGVDARVSERGTRIAARAAESQSGGGERVDQRIPVLEGGRARIATGASRPLQLRDGAVIQDIATGFDVVLRLAGDTVLLEIAPQREVAGTVTRGSVQVQRASSTLRSRLGEWVELAGIDGGSSSRRIWVKVDEVRP